MNAPVEFRPDLSGDLVSAGEFERTATFQLRSEHHRGPGDPTGKLADEAVDAIGQALASIPSNGVQPTRVAMSAYSAGSIASRRCWPVRPPSLSGRVAMSVITCW